jgi:hypothetical protein
MPPTNEKARNVWEEIKDSWKVIASVTGILAVLVMAWVEQRVVSIHKAQVAEVVVVVPANVTDLEQKTALTDQAVATNGVAIQRVETAVIRVEGKLDDLILLLQRRGP